MSKTFNSKTLPLLAFTALAITSFATSASASCFESENEMKTCLSGREDSGNQPMGTMINQTVNTLTSTAQTMGYTGPANTSGSAQGASLPAGLGGSSASSGGYVDTNGNPVIVSPRPGEGVPNADGSNIIPVDRTYVNGAGKITTDTIYVTVPGESGNNVDNWIQTTLSRGPLGGGGGNPGVFNSIIKAAGSGPDLTNGGNGGGQGVVAERRADSRSGSAPATTATFAPNKTVTATDAMLNKLGMGGRDASRTTITTNSSGKVTAIVTDHRTQTAPKMVSMVATPQKSGPIAPPVYTAPKPAQTPIALPSATTIKAK